MKKIYALLAAPLFLSQAFAQDFVSTTPENRNAVLEEFTGIYCGYCPDGHKQANEFKAANQGDVVLINIHQSETYAAPRGEDPDFRTSFADAIAGQADIRGYPAGTVNRELFSGSSQGSGTAQSRGSWASTGAQILAQSSPVNVDFISSYDRATREMSVTVEAYYTADGAGSSNFVNVAILQNNVEGPQSGATNFYPEKVLENGNYVHGHMLRHLITGQWGEEITEVAMGSFYTKTFTYTLPEALNGIDYVLADLEIAVFITETKQNIVTGVSGPFDYLLPEEKIDLATTNISSSEGDLCSEEITPSMEIENLGPNDITSFDLVCNINGTDYKQTFTGDLKIGDKTTVTWDPVSLPGGEYTMTISSPSNINEDALEDIKPSNSGTVTVNGYSMIPGAIEGQVSAGFDLEVPSNFAIDDSENGAYALNDGFGANYSAGAIVMLLDNGYGVEGKPLQILFGQVDVADMTDPVITYHYAYADGDQNGTAPTIEVEVSTNCGESWNSLKKIDAEETTDIVIGNLYRPLKNDYIWVKNELGEYASEDFIGRISITPGSDGNALWFDEVGIADAATSVSDPIANNIGIFPNPAKDYTTVNVTAASREFANITVYNAVGELVTVLNSDMLAEGLNQFTINTSSLDNGVYFVRYESDNSVSNSQFVVNK